MLYSTLSGRFSRPHVTTGTDGTSTDGTSSRDQKKRTSPERKGHHLLRLRDSSSSSSSSSSSRSSSYTSSFFWVQRCWEYETTCGNSPCGHFWRLAALKRSNDQPKPTGQNLKKTNTVLDRNPTTKEFESKS